MNLKDNLQFKIAQKMQSTHESLQQYPPLDVCYMLFKNVQYSKDTCSGLRLTKLGWNLLKTHYDVYKFPIDEGLHKNILLKLHEHMAWPYYLEKKALVLFSEEDAMWLKMMSNDVEKFAKGLD